MVARRHPPLPSRVRRPSRALRAGQMAGDGVMASDRSSRMTACVLCWSAESVLAAVHSDSPPWNRQQGKPRESDSLNGLRRRSRRLSHCARSERMASGLGRLGWVRELRSAANLDTLAGITILCDSPLALSKRRSRGARSATGVLPLRARADAGDIDRSLSSLRMTGTRCDVRCDARCGAIIAGSLAPLDHRTTTCPARPFSRSQMK